MKTTKLILLFTLCLILFNGCYSEELYNETTVETNLNNRNLKATNEEKSNSIQKIKKTKFKLNTNIQDQQANKTDDWFNNPNGNSEIDSTTPYTINSIEIIVEYSGNVTQQEKQETRNNYGNTVGLVTFEELDNDSDLWVIDKNLYNTVGPVASCCPIVISTEAEIDDISLWGSFIFNATNTSNPNS